MNEGHSFSKGITFGNKPSQMAATTGVKTEVNRIFIVQRVRAFYRGDRTIEVAGVFVSLKDANDMVRRCKDEFKRDYDISDPEDGDEEYGFKYVDLGDDYDGTPDPSGTTVGLYWEFDEWQQFDGAQGWFSCRVECFPLTWPQS